jgi:hypothetical protein
MPANDHSDGLSCAPVEALSADDCSVAQPQAASRPASCRVVDNLPEIIAVTSKEISAIEMFLGASLDRLLSE